MKEPIDNLIVVAHPDDETLYFSGLILNECVGTTSVICVTDGDADGKGIQRKEQWSLACKLLGVENHNHWAYPDAYEKRLNVLKLEQDLRMLPKPKMIYSHSVIGEYGHPHHQDVSLAVHRAFSKDGPVYSVAHNLYPDKSYTLTPSQYALKTKILSEVYGDETVKFLNLVPAVATDGFVEVSLLEVERIYEYLSQGKTLSPSDLDKYKWLFDHIELTLGKSKERLF